VFLFCFCFFLFVCLFFVFFAFWFLWKETKSLPLIHKYMTAHYPGLVQALQYKVGSVVSVIVWYIWIYNYLCNQCLSPLLLSVRISIKARCTTLCDKVCQWLATDRWFSPGPLVSSTNKTDSHDITEILLKVALNTIKQTNMIYWGYWGGLFFCFCFV
jgi:hypothetical protein